MTSTLLLCTACSSRRQWTDPFSSREGKASSSLRTALRPPMGEEGIPLSTPPMDGATGGDKNAGKKTPSSALVWRRATEQSCWQVTELCQCTWGNPHPCGPLMPFIVKKGVDCHPFCGKEAPIQSSGPCRPELWPARADLSLESYLWSAILADWPRDGFA